MERLRFAVHRMLEKSQGRVGLSDKSTADEPLFDEKQTLLFRYKNEGNQERRSDMQSYKYLMLEINGGKTCLHAYLSLTKAVNFAHTQQSTRLSNWWSERDLQSLLPPSHILSDQIFWRLPWTVQPNLAIGSRLKHIRLFLCIEDVFIVETPFLFKSLLHLCTDASLCCAFTCGFWNAILRGRGFGRSWWDAACGCVDRALVLGFQNAFIPLGTIFHPFISDLNCDYWKLMELYSFLNNLRSGFGDNIALLSHFFEVYLSIG